jgi:hypothetical protein
MTAIHWNPQTIGEQMRSASRVVEVRAQEHCDYASIVKVQRAFDELSRQRIGWIALTPVSGDVAAGHVETSLP